LKGNDIQIVLDGSSVVVTLWMVADTCTYQLMIEFYKQLMQNGASRAGVLQQVIIKTMGKYPHIYY
jgi:CHAT domain-containing protein